MCRVLFGLAVPLSAGVLLASCGGGGGAQSVPGGAPLTPNAAVREIQTVVFPTPPGCTPVITVNPATHYPTRTARRFTGGEHFNLDATGCDYGIYLGPNVKHAEIEDAKVHGAGRISIITEGAQDVRIRETATNGGPVAGIEFTYGSSGSVERSYVTNTETGVEFIFNARGLVGETLITNTTFLGINIVYNSQVTVEDTLIDNAMNTGSGVAVQNAGSVGVVRRTTAIGAGVPTPFGPQFGFFFGHGHPTVKAEHNTARHNQTGFGSYCVAGIDSADDLTDAHNRAVSSTVTNYDVNNNPAGINCI